MEQEAAPDFEPPGVAWRYGAVAAATLELCLATVAHTYSAAGICPTGGVGSTCVALIRPRLAALGPISVSHVAVVGATLAVGLATLLAVGKASRGLTRCGVAALAAGVGFAVGVQVLPWRVSGALCVLCLGVVLASALATALIGYVSVVGHRLRWHEPALACVVALVLTAPLALWRADTLRAEDAARLEALAHAGGEGGPTLILVTRPGCPYCEAFRVDSLGDPQVIDALERTRGVREVREGSDEAKAYGSVRGAPTLIAVAGNGSRLGEVEGHRHTTYVLAWLDQVAPR